MSEPKHTPGPWFITKEDWVTGGYDIAVIQDKNGEEVLGISEWIRVNEPDLRLIAAAPDMYEALEEVIKIYSFKEMVRTDKTINSPRDDPDRGKIFFTYNDLSKARNALRKARGETE